MSHIFYNQLFLHLFWCAGQRHTRGTYIYLSSGHDSSVLLCRTEAGAHLAPAVSVGDRVLLPEYGGAKVGLELAGNQCSGTKYVR